MKLRAGLPVAVFMTLLCLGGVSRADEVPEELQRKIHGAEPGDPPAPTPPPPLEQEVPAQPPTSPKPVVSTYVPTRPRSQGLFIGGMVTGVAGLAIVIAGSTIETSRAPSACGHLTSLGKYVYGGDCALAGAAAGASNFTRDLVIGTGAVMIASGITMAVIGGWEVPITRPVKPRTGALPGASRPTASLVAGPTSGSLKLTF